MTLSLTNSRLSDHNAGSSRSYAFPACDLSTTRRACTKPYKSEHFPPEPGLSPAVPTPNDTTTHSPLNHPPRSLNSRPGLFSAFTFYFVLKIFCEIIFFTMNSIAPVVPPHVRNEIEEVLNAQLQHLVDLAETTRERYLDALIDLGVWLYRVKTSDGKSPKELGLWNGTEFRTLADLVHSKNQAEVDEILNCFTLKNNNPDGGSCDHVFDAMAAVRPLSTAALKETRLILGYFPELAEDVGTGRTHLGYFCVWLHWRAEQYDVTMRGETHLWEGAIIPMLYKFIVYDNRDHADRILACFKEETLCENDEAVVAVTKARDFLERVDSEKIASFFRYVGNQ